MSWDKWLKNRITESQEFFALCPSPPETHEALNQILDRFPMSVPEYYLSLIDFNDPEDPIRRMSLPSLSELNMAGSFDTSGEGSNTVLTGTQHKYSQTALVLSTNNCAMYCRHCFRKRLVGLTNEEVLRLFEESMRYISSHEEISNVLVSGGDSFMLDNASIKRYLEALSQMEHLDFIRFGTRTPVVLPARIYEDKALLELLGSYNKKKHIIIVTQFNHPRELTEESKKAVDALNQQGLEVRNQTVLLRGVNDDPYTLSELMRGLTRFGVAPYYVFQCRPVSGVGTQFQVPLVEGFRIVDQAKGKLCGPAKCFRYAMSHETGKIEILGLMPDGKMLFKYHQAKHSEDASRIFTTEVAPDQAWLESVPR